MDEADLVLRVRSGDEEAFRRLVAAELAERIRPRIDELPDMPRRVVLLRDVEGLRRHYSPRQPIRA